MNPERLFRACAAIGIFSTLAACGGGGGGGSADTAPGSGSGSGSGDAGQQPAVSIYTAGTASVSAPTLTSNLATNGFAWTNAQRAALGLSPLARAAALDTAAGAHAAYIAANNSYATEGHNETVGRTGFTGATPADRIAAAGFTGQQNSENMSSGALTGADASRDLIDAPYHRQTQLGNFASAGAAVNAGGVYVIDFAGQATGFGPSANQLVVFPKSGDAAAPIDWFNRESPSPLPDLPGQRVGYPVSIGGVGSFALTSFSLADDRNVAVTARTLTTRTDNSQSLGAYAFIVPLAPLAAGTRYTARAVGSLNAIPFDVSWSFTTAALRTLALTSTSASVPAAAGATVDVTVSGGTGRYLSATSNNSISYTRTGPLVDFNQIITVASVTADTVRLTRGPQSCSDTVSNCTITLTGRDSAGTQTTLTLPIQ